MFTTVRTFMDKTTRCGILPRRHCRHELGAHWQHHNAAQKQEDKTEGITQDKNSLRDSLEDQIRTVGDAIYAYASSIANYTLAAEVETKPSELDTMSEQRLDDVAQRIIDAGSANLAELGPYNITQAKLDALDQARADFQGAKGKPRTKISEKAGYTGTLAADDS